MRAGLGPVTGPAIGSQDTSFGGYKATLLGKATVASDAVRLSQAEDAYQMIKRGLIAENFPLASANQALVCVSQSLYQLKVWLPEDSYSVTGIVLAVTTAGSTLTSAQNLATLYLSDGTLKGSTADQSAVWTTAGPYAMALGGGPYTIAGGDGVFAYVTVLSNGTTPATFATGPNRFAMNASSAGALSGAALMAGRNGTAITAAPSPLVPANAVITSANSIWVGLY